MLELATAYLKAYSAKIVDVRHLKRQGVPVITIDAKLPSGDVATFQLRGRTLYRQHFNPKSREFITDEVVFQFSA